ncbi:MAG: hypothetical protein JEY71_18100 [Sphaerochaeta sp.]|nr:hypothetical protein [Sphaerochaeta sp.]
MGDTFHLMLEFVRGFFISKRLLKGNTNCYILNNQHIGDVCYSLSLIDSFCKEKKALNVVVIWSGKFKELYDSFDIKCLFRMSSENQRRLQIYLLKSQTGKKLIENGRLVVTYTSFFMNSEEQESNEITVMDLLKTKSFRISKDSLIHFPSINRNGVGNVIQSLNIKKHRTVFINPFALSMSVPVSFFQKIAKRLAEHGYDVVSNMRKEDDVPINGTKGVFLSLNDSFCLMEYCGYTVGVRSGFYDFSISAKCSFHIIYEQEYKMKKAYSLKAWNSVHPLREYVYKTDVENELIEDIISQFPFISLGVNYNIINGKIR